jgi:hypothetical protein
MAAEDQARPFFAGFGLEDVARVSDPDARLYRTFGLERGRLSQVLGPSVWLRGAAAVARGHRVGLIVGDSLQMPGVFLVDGGEVVKAFRHESSGDIPDYLALATCPLPRR